MPDATAFKALRRFNAPELRELAGRGCRIDSRWFRHFDSESLQDRIVRQLALRRALPVKEVFESFEVFARTRKRLREAHLADVCCGHGLTGLLFAAFERRVEKVTLIDRRQPASFAEVQEALCAEAPWVADKVEYRVGRVQRAESYLQPETAVLAVHACGERTDHALELACRLGGPVAVMPCCYSEATARGPAALKTLGTALAADIDRTYRLEARGYRVSWTSIPAEISPMHRILNGIPDRSSPNLENPKTPAAGGSEG